MGILAALGIVISLYLSNGNKPLDMNQWKSVKEESDDKNQLKFAIASMVSAEQSWHSYKNFVKHISSKIGLKDNLILRKSYKDTRIMLEKDLVDIAFVCTGTYVASLEKKQIELLAVPEFEEGLQYKCYIIVNSKRNIKEIGELKGKVFAHTDPESNTGCIVPKWIFNKIGMSDASFKKIIYTGSHDRSIHAVANSHVDAAAVDALIYHSLIKYEQGLAEKLNVIWESPAFGSPPIVVNKNLSPERKDTLQKVLLAYGETQDEKHILQTMAGTGKNFKKINNAIITYSLFIGARLYLASFCSFQFYSPSIPTETAKIHGFGAG
jgi:phosphonate transport system substrate-binding protein